MLNPHAPLLRQAAQAACGHQQHPAGALYVVATPIGNLADLSLRAIHVLGLCQAVACEDTRVSAPLLAHLGLKPALLALHRHNEREAAAQVLARLAAGDRVALVSDAGTPAIADPGARLVQAAAAAGHRVLPIPGPSSVAALLSVAGDDQADDDPASAGHVFAGFAPSKGAERQRWLAARAAEPRTQVMFEAPHRIANLLQGLAQALGPQAGQRRLTLGRELTKQFETITTLPAAEAPAWLAAQPGAERGEFVLALHARPAARSLSPGEQALDAPSARLLQALLAHTPPLPLKAAVGLAQQATGAARKPLYARALQLRAAAERDDDDDGGLAATPDGDAHDQP